MVLRAGAMMVETMMRLKPVAERTSVTVHFFTVGQSSGLLGHSQFRNGRSDKISLLFGIKGFVKADQVRIVAFLLCVRARCSG